MPRDVLLIIMVELGFYLLIGLQGTTLLKLISIYTIFLVIFQRLGNGKNLNIQMRSIHNSFAPSDTSEGACCIWTFRSGNGNHSLNKDFYRSLCPLRDFETLTTLNRCCIASHRGDFASYCFYFHRYSAIASQFFSLHLVCRASQYLIVASAVSDYTVYWRIWLAVGRTAEDVTYRSDFDKTFQEVLTDKKHLSADDISLSQR